MDTASLLLREVFRRNLTNTFARSWYDRQGTALRQQWGDRKADFVDSFQVPGPVFEQFLDFARESGISFGDDSDSFSAEDLAADRAFLEARIKARLAVRLFGLDAFFPIIHTEDRTFKESMVLWESAIALANQ